MNLDDCMLTCLCRIDDRMQRLIQRRLREQRPVPKLAESEVVG